VRLKQSNPYLRNLSAAEQRAALRVAVETSSAVEGIRAPFTSGQLATAPTTKSAFIAYWRQRAAVNAR
jgi:hypothetical protein